MRTNLVAVAPVANVPQANALLLNPAGSLMRLFERLKLRERLVRIRRGLRLPPESGEHKWAVVERQRLVGAVAAWAVPFGVALLLLLLRSTPTPVDGTRTNCRPAPPAPDPLDHVTEKADPPRPDPIPGDRFNVGLDVPRLAGLTADVNLPAEPPLPTLGSVIPTRSPLALPGIHPGRTPAGRKGALDNNRAGYTDLAVLRALRWLKTQQASDGSWPQTRPAMTAMALLAYLAYGETTSSPEFGATIERALRCLVEAQEGSGRFRGRDGNDYTQPIAAYALAEAYGMLHLPQLKAPAEKAIRVVIDGQNAVGGFSYNLMGPSDTRNDLTYTGWCVQALKAAKISALDAAGLEECMRKALDGVRRNYGQSGGYGGFGYTAPGGSGGAGLSGAGVLCLQFLGDTTSDEYRGGIAGLDKAVFVWENIPEDWSRSPLYYGYYITQARFQHGGESWRGWKDQFAPVLVRHQTVLAAAASGYTDDAGKVQDIGYWDSPSPSEQTGGNGRMMDTLLATLTLEVYYRYLPTFAVAAPKTAKPAAAEEPLVTVDLRSGQEARRQTSVSGSQKDRP